MKLKLETGVENEILRTISKSVDKVDKKLVKFVEDMKTTMKKEKGIGLAAPQVGRNIRVIVVELDCDTKNSKVLGMINPQITYTSEEKELGQEGCLSIPGFYDNVVRSKEIVVEFLDKKGEKQILRLENLNARVVQHEVDHLDGILFVDRLDDSKEEANLVAGAL